MPLVHGDAAVIGYMEPLDVVEFEWVAPGWYNVLLISGHQKWWELLSAAELGDLLESH